MPGRANAYSPELQPPQGQTESSFLREYVPIQPSQKALGKLRRVSQGAGAFLSFSLRIVSLAH